MKNKKRRKIYEDPFEDYKGQIEKCKKSKYKSLKIGWNLHIKEFPEEIRKLKWLTSLTVSCTDIKVIPDWIGELVNLKKLDISSNQKVRRLPSTIINQKNLKYLDIESTGINRLPSFIGKLQSLEYLKINTYGIKNVHLSILDLPKLKRIVVGDTENINKDNLLSLYEKCMELNIKEALRRIKSCKRNNTKKIDLSCLYLEKLPNELLEIDGLEEINFYCNNLKKLPNWIEKLNKLKVFDVSCNKLTSLPNSIGNLRNLKCINLSDNKIKTLPESFGNLSFLEEFYLYENDNSYPEGDSWFIKLPESFGNLSSLKVFSIWNTRLKMLPKSFGKLKSLKSLTIQTDDYLAKNFFPDTMKNLKSITELKINGFTKVPEFVANFKNLTKLDIEHNRLYNLPDFIGKLSKLTVLNLHSTWITEIPEWIVNLKNLEKLDISSNELSFIDPELPNKMPKLKKLFKWYLKEYNIN